MTAEPKTPPRPGNAGDGPEAPAGADRDRFETAPRAAAPTNRPQPPGPGAKTSTAEAAKGEGPAGRGPGRGGQGGPVPGPKGPGAGGKGPGAGAKGNAKAGAPQARGPAGAPGPGPARQAAAQQGPAGQPGRPARAPAPVPPPVPPARLRRRHWMAIFGFIVIVILPVAVAAWYLYTRAADQFASTVGFSVRKEEFSSPIELFGGIADFGSSGVSDSDILYEFIRSQEMVETLEQSIGLSQLYAKPQDDPVFAYDPESGAIERLHWRWSWMTRVDYDPSSQLIEVRTLAFTPEDARLIARAVFDESARLVEELSDVARDDTTRFAREELERAVERLKDARQAMSDFRSRTQIVDPTADLQGQMGLLSTLEQQLAAALIDADLLRENSREGDIRIEQADKRIEIIQRRIDEERRKLGVGAGVADDGGDYATLLTEYEGLAVDREFAEQAYTAALAAYDTALAEARRKSRYLAAYIKPTLAQTSEYPRRGMILLAAAFFLFCIWAVTMLIYYAIRDRR